MPLGPKSPCSTYVDHFVHSKNAKFSGDSKRQRIKRAVGACYAAKHRRSIPTQRSEEVVNELSARVLKPYMKGVEGDIENRERNLTHSGLKKIQSRLKYHGKAEKKVKEETEVNEVSKGVLKSYVKKAAKDMKAQQKKPLSDEKSNRKFANRFFGVIDAKKRLGK